MSQQECMGLIDRVRAPPAMREWFEFSSSGDNNRQNLEAHEDIWNARRIEEEDCFRPMFETEGP